MNRPEQMERMRLSCGRVGFTLTELLVVIAIIGILVVLVGFGVKSALDISRRAQCLNNIRGHMGTVLRYAAENNNQLPYSYSGASGKMGFYWYETLYMYAGGEDLLEAGGHNARMEVIGESGMFQCPGNRELSIGYGWSYPNLPYRPPADESLPAPSRLYMHHWEDLSRVMVMGCAEKLTGAVTGFIYSPFPGPDGFPAMWEEDFSRAGNIGRGHGKGASFAFLDGHAEWRTFQEITPPEPESRYFWGLENK